MMKPLFLLFMYTILRKIKIVLIVGFVLFIFISCSDKSTEPQETLFTLTYELETPRDTTVNAVELETITYYPEVDKSWYSLKNYQKRDFNKRLIVKPPDKVYVGCTRELQINIAKHWQPDDIFASFRCYLFNRDTISSIEDSLFYVRFPEDTVKAIRIY